MVETPTVQLLITCLIDTLFPDAGEAVLDVLEAQGVRVEFPAGQTCCGQPAYNAGFRAEARAMALHLLDVFEAGSVNSPSAARGAALRDDERRGATLAPDDSSPSIVCPSGSCTAML